MQKNTEHFHHELCENIIYLINETQNSKNNTEIIKKVLETLSKPCFMDADKALFMVLNGLLKCPSLLSFSEDESVDINFKNPNLFIKNYSKTIHELADKINYHPEYSEIISQFVRGNTHTKLNGIITSTIGSQLIDFSNTYKVPIKYADEILSIFKYDNITSFILQENILNNKTYITSLYRIGNKKPFSKEQSNYFKNTLVFLYKACFINNALLDIESYNRPWIALLRNDGNKYYCISDVKNDILLNKFNKYLKENGNAPLVFNIIEKSHTYLFYWVKLQNINININEHKNPIIAIMICKREHIKKLVTSSVFRIDI